MTPLSPNYEASWSFVTKFHPGRSVVVTAVSLDKKSIPTDTFGPGEKERFLKWVAACGKSEMNIYFSVAEVIGKVTSKINRTDVKAVHYLHVDLDPRAGENVESEQKRILELLRNPPGGLPGPTAITYSGGGYQAYWKLSEPLAVDGSEEVAEDLKLYNIQIERLLGGDHCHDVSRIMRVPGTINLPDAKKIKKGRVPALAQEVEWHDDRVYDIKQFVKAPMVQSGVATGAGIGTAPKIRAPGNVKQFAHVDELGKAVSDGVKVYIVQGENPNEPNHFKSRSEMLFWVVCELTRAGLDEETIYAVLVNKDWRISESVLEKGNGAERYALRQIERAREQAVDPNLREFNDRHAVIENFGGKCVVIEEIFDDQIKRFRLTKQGFDHFRNRYMNKKIDLGSKMVKGKPVEQDMPAGDWWLYHPQRRQYTNVVFSPGKDVTGAYNLWRGFGCEARPGDCSLFLNHLRDIVCGGNEDYYKFLIAWMANTVQNPGHPGQSAVVMRGKQGCGKSIVPELFGDLFGRHYIMVNNSKHLVGQFNAHLRDCVLLFADEAFFAGDKANESVLKTIVTEPVLQIELKGVDAEPSANCVHLMMASNEKWVVPAGYDDRRYFVLDCKPTRVGDRKYFGDMVKQMREQGGKEALLHYLMTYDMKASGIDIRNTPKTAALQEQKSLSMNVESEWWMNVLKQGTLLTSHSEWHDFVSMDLLLIDYINYTRNFSIHRRGNASRMEISLKEFVPGLKKFQRTTPVEIPQPDGKVISIARPWNYRIPDLQTCRKYFDANFGGPYQWEGDEPVEEIPEYGDDILS